MNPVRVAKTLVESLRDQPIALTMLALNCIFLAFLVWVLREVGDLREKQLTETRSALMQNRDILLELQRTCVRFEPPPERR